MLPARYRIVDTIGRGGMGEVCLAEDVVLHRQVALKFVTLPAAGDGLDHLLAEARAAAALDHPFICSIYDVSTLDDRPCIAMEYVRGETMERRLRRGPLPAAEALRLAEEIAEALDAAHKRRVVHRDLKPANVMVTEDQHIKVMDFGLAMRLPADDEAAIAGHAPLPAATVVGTPAYMAPEQIRGGATDRRSDIFSFGILLYQLLTGTHPFQRPGVDATLAAILGEAPPDLPGRTPGLPPPVSGVVMRLLEKDPAARYQSFADVRADLRRASAQLTGAAIMTATAIAHRGAHESSVRLIGREAERAQLLQAITDATSAGRGTLLVLAGEAGLGKTRLAEEALATARRRGCQTLVGRCSEQEGTPPLVPYIELLEGASRLLPAAAFRQAVGASGPELARLLPELHRLIPDLPASLELPPALRQRFLFTNIRDFLARASQLAPLVILLDNVQWADDPTLQMTQQLAPHLSTLPIVVIAACREADMAPAAARGTLQQLVDRVRGQARQAPSAPARSVLADLVSEGHARRVTLRPLTESEVRRMLAELADREPPARLARQFHQQTGGNPYFVSELFRHLKDEGALFRATGAWRRDVELAELAQPDSVRTVMARRLERVSRETQDVLRAAAVIGPHFDLDLLEAAAGVGEDALMAALEEAEHAHLVKGPSGRQDVTWRFTHQLIVQTLRHAMPTLRRQRLHLRVADAMAQLHSLARPYTAEIAHHLYSAGRLAPTDRTAQALVAASKAAHVMYATEDAVRHCRRALEVLAESGDDATSLVVEERLADLLALLGDRAAAMEHYRHLSTVHEAQQHSVEHARAVRKIGTLEWQAGNRAEAMACYQRALEALAGSHASIEAAHLYQELGLAAFRTGDNPHAIEWANRALRAAEQALAVAPVDAETRKAAATAVAHATNTIGVALARSGQVDAARERIERSVQAAREAGLLDVACRGYANLGVLYSTIEPQRAIEVSLTGLELASRIGAASMQSYIYANLAAAYCALTDRCESEGLAAARAAADLDRQLGQLDHLAVPLVVIAQIYQCRGELQEAQQHYAEALALAERAGEAQLLLPCYDGLATIALDRGDRTRAEEYMTRARELCERTGLDPDTLLLLPFLS